MNRHIFRCNFDFLCGRRAATSKTKRYTTGPTDSGFDFIEVRSFLFGNRDFNLTFKAHTSANTSIVFFNCTSQYRLMLSALIYPGNICRAHTHTHTHTLSSTLCFNAFKVTRSFIPWRRPPVQPQSSSVGPPSSSTRAIWTARNVLKDISVGVSWRRREPAAFPFDGRHFSWQIRHPTSQSSHQPRWSKLLMSAPCWNSTFLWNEKKQSSVLVKGFWKSESIRPCCLFYHSLPDRVFKATELEQNGFTSLSYYFSGSLFLQVWLIPLIGLGEDWTRVCLLGPTVNWMLTSAC